MDPRGHEPWDPNWLARFEQQNHRQPTEQDWEDYQFSQSHPGSGPYGSWTTLDWRLYGGIAAVEGSDFARANWSSVAGAERLITAQVQSNVASGPRRPDYYTASLNVSVPNPVTLTLVGPTFELTRDRYGRWYFTLGASVGKSPLIASAGVVGGWILQNQPAGREQLENYLTQWGVNVSGGYFVGAGVTWGNVGSFAWSDFSFEAGAFYPWQFGATGSYTWEIR